VADGIEHQLHPLDAMGAGFYVLAGDPRIENWSGFTFE